MSDTFFVVFRFPADTYKVLMNVYTSLEEAESSIERFEANKDVCMLCAHTGELLYHTDQKDNFIEYYTVRYTVWNNSISGFTSCFTQKVDFCISPFDKGREQALAGARSFARSVLEPNEVNYVIEHIKANGRKETIDIVEFNLFPRLSAMR